MCFFEIRLDLGLLQSNSLGLSFRDALYDFAGFQVEFDDGRVPFDRTAQFTFQFLADSSEQLFQRQFLAISQ
jgi:hypothetical protein